MALSCPVIPCSAGIEQVLFTYSKYNKTIHDGEKDDVILRYITSLDISSIDEANETVFIDYENLRLYRYDKSDNSCKSFLLKNPVATVKQTIEKKELALQRMSNLLGNFKVISTDGRKRIKTYNCLEKQILFAYELSFSQLAVPPIINQYGQDFTESVVSYWVTREIDSYDILLKIARRHKEIYEANPLLRQIDILGLIEELEGVPVQISKTVKKKIKEYTLLSIEQTDKKNKLFILPQACK